jgi:Tol biopolymer transport system component
VSTEPGGLAPGHASRPSKRTAEQTKEKAMKTTQRDNRMPHQPGRLIRGLMLLAALALTAVQVQTAPLTGNGKIAFYRGDPVLPPQLWIMDPDGNNLAALIPDEWVGPAAWSPDGTRIALTIANPFNTSGNGLYVMNADGSGRVKLPMFGAYPSWSADGTRLAVSSASNIWVINVDGSGTPQQLTTDGFQNVFPSWSPDGSQIAYEHQRRYSTGVGYIQCCDQIWVVNTDPANPNPHALSDPVATAVCCAPPNCCFANAYDYYPRWSPDGTRILFETSRADPNSPSGGRVQAWVMNADGSNQHAVSTNIFNEYYPAWSPDGTKIVFASERDDLVCGGIGCKFEIYTMTATGQNTVRLTYNAGLDIYPAWQPTAGGSDTTPPTVRCVGPIGGGWSAADVTVNCTASDPSGLLNPADASFTLSTNVSPGTETANALTDSRQVCDALNNCAPTNGPYGPFKVDRKGPTITIAAPANNSVLLLNQPLASNYGCLDGGSGLFSCVGPVANGSSIDTKAVGAKSFTVDASDQVGNTASATNSYTVSFDVKTMGTHKTVSLRLVNFGSSNVSSPSIRLTVQSIDGVAVAGQTFTFMSNGYRYTPAGLSKGPHTLVFIADGDPVPHTVPFTT